MFWLPLVFALSCLPPAAPFGDDQDETGIDTDDTSSHTDTDTPASSAPVAHAGADLAVVGRTTVHLDGTGSTDPDGDPLGFDWVQVSGPSAALSDRAAAKPSFIAPDEHVALEFELTVSDGRGGASTDRVRVDVVKSGSGAVDLDGPPLFSIDVPSVVDLCWDGPHLYVLTAAKDLLVFDVSDRAYPELLSSTTLTIEEAASVAAHGDLVVVAGVGLVVVDVSTPTAPAQRGSWKNPYASSSESRTGHVVLAGHTALLAWTSLLFAIDVSDPSAPIQLSQAPADGPVLGIEARGDYAYAIVAPTFSAPRLIALDLKNPVPLTTTWKAYFSSGDKVGPPTLAGDRIYVAHGRNSHLLRHFEMSNPARPTLDSGAGLVQYNYVGGDLPRPIAASGRAVGRHTGPDQFESFEVLDGGWWERLTPPAMPWGPWRHSASQGDEVWVAADRPGVPGWRIHLVDFARAPERHWGYTMSTEWAWHLEHDADRVLLTHSAGLSVFDVSDVESPALLSNHATINGTLLRHDDLLYVCGSKCDFYDFTDHTAPYRVGGYTPTDYGLPVDLSVDGKRLYFASLSYSGTSSKSAQVVDLSIIANASRLGTGGVVDATGFARRGTTGFVSAKLGLFTQDLSQNSPPTVGSWSPPSAQAHDVAVKGNVAYVATDDGLAVIDATDPTALKRLRMLDESGTELQLEGDTLVLHGRGLVSVFDVSVPDRPRVLRRFRGLAESTAALLVGDGIVLAGGETWFKRLDDAPEITGSSTPKPGSAERYLVSWTSVDAVSPWIRCVAGGGTCRLVSVDHATNTAEIEWTLPAEAGPYDLALVLDDFDWTTVGWFTATTTP